MTLERTIGLGWTAEGYRVTANIRLEPANPERTVTFTDHTEGPRPADLGISFTVQDMRLRSNGYYHGGQVSPEDRVIARRHGNDASPETAAFIDQAWSDHHLNVMHAECDHMAAEELERADGESATDWQHRMLHEATCPVTGYQWGHAWLARAIPADVLEKLERLIATGTIAD
jgi:hypothetical protein